MHPQALERGFNSSNKVRSLTFLYNLHLFVGKMCTYYTEWDCVQMTVLTSLLLMKHKQQITPLFCISHLYIVAGRILYNNNYYTRIYWAKFWLQVCLCNYCSMQWSCISSPICSITFTNFTHSVRYYRVNSSDWYYRTRHKFFFSWHCL